MQETSGNPGCSFVRCNLFLYQENRLDAAMRKEFEEHLHSCKPCATVAAEFCSVFSGTGRNVPVGFDPFVQTRTIAGIEAEIERGNMAAHSVFQRMVRPALAAFILIFAVVVGFSMGTLINRKVEGDLARQDDIRSMKADLFIPDFTDEDIMNIDEP
jgi:hypothetical protein